MSAIINCVKTVNKSGTIIGDILTYTIEIDNIGDTSANSVIFSDEIPQGLGFVQDTFMINGISYSGVNPQSQKGVAVGVIAAGDKMTISFKARVESMPINNKFENIATIKFKYTANQGVPNGVSESVDSNKAITTVSQVGIDIKKYTDKSGATIDDVITYTIVLSNTGNIALTNIMLIDTLPKETTFITEPFNSQIFLRNNPLTFSLGTIQPQSITTIGYKVHVNTLPNINPVNNSAYVCYNYVLDPLSSKIFSNGIVSNMVTTNIVQANLSAINLVDNIGVTLGDNINYTLVIRNTGNIMAENVVVIDTIPNNVVFVIDSLRLNGISQVGKNTLTPGFMVGNILAGRTCTITFRVLVDTIPSQNIVSNNASISYEYTSNTNNTGGNKRSINTNEVRTTISKAILVATKMVDKTIASINEKIKYTLQIKNIGNTIATNIKVMDNIPQGVNFVFNSLIINQITQIGVNLQNENRINIGDVLPGETVNVSFEVTVSNSIIDYELKNSATITYKYTVNLNNINDVSDTISTNEVITSIKEGKVSVYGFSNKNAVGVGGLINYGIAIKNTGNVRVLNIKVTDTIPNGSLFYPESVKINGIVDVNSDPMPPIGINIGSLELGQIATITFDVIATTMPNPNIISNNATVMYNYSIDPLIQNQYTRNENISNINVFVNQAILTIKKTVEKETLKLGSDTKIYLEIKNIGNVKASNIVLIDTIPQGTILKEDSIEIDGNKQPGETIQPPVGLSIASISEASKRKVRYTVTAVTIVNNSGALPQENIATIFSEYKADYVDNIIYKDSQASNGISIKVKDASLLVNNLVDREYATVGDILNYTILLNNTGNVDLNNVIFTENISSKLSIISNSIVLNGNTLVGVIFSPPRGILIGRIQAGDFAKITFRAVVKELPILDKIDFSGEAKYEYTIIFGQEYNSSKVKGNTISVNINQVNLDFNNIGGITKYTESTFATLGDVITYKVEIGNKGNVAAENMFFTDTLSQYLTFIDDSFIVDGNVQYGKNPKILEVDIGNIGPNEIARLSYKVKVNTIPNPNIIITSCSVRYKYTVNPITLDERSKEEKSNYTTNVIRNANISFDDGGLIKSSDKDLATVGSTITYSIMLRNTGNIAADNVIFVDSVPSETTFIQNSVVLNGVARPTMNPNSGIKIDKIKSGDYSLISFKVKVNNLGIIKPAINVGMVRYSYILDPSIPKIKYVSNITNTVTTPIGIIKMSKENGGIKKIADKIYTDLNDIIQYKVVLTNKGNLVAKNVTVYDTIPDNAKLVLGSVFINEVNNLNSNPNIGVYIGDIQPNIPVTISYSVKIKSLATNTANKIKNTLEVYYEYPY